MPQSKDPNVCSSGCCGDLCLVFVYRFLYIGQRASPMSVAPMVHRMATWGGLLAPFLLSLLTLAGQTPPGDREMGIEDVLVPLARLLHLLAAARSCRIRQLIRQLVRLGILARLKDRLDARLRVVELEEVASSRTASAPTCEATQTRPRCPQRMSESRALSTAVYSRSCTPAQATSTRYYSLREYSRYSCTYYNYVCHCL